MKEKKLFYVLKNLLKTVYNRLIGQCLKRQPDARGMSEMQSLGLKPMRATHLALSYMCKP